MPAYMANRSEIYMSGRNGTIDMDAHNGETADQWRSRLQGAEVDRVANGLHVAGNPLIVDAIAATGLMTCISTMPARLVSRAKTAVERGAVTWLHDCGDADLIKYLRANVPGVEIRAVDAWQTYANAAAAVGFAGGIAGPSWNEREREGYRQVIIGHCVEHSQAVGDGTSAEPAKKASVRRSWDSLLSLPAVEWEVGGLFPVGGIVVIAAEPSVGKTLCTIDMALRRLHGMSWFGAAARPGSTLYAVGEGWFGLGARVRGWRTAHPEAIAVPDAFCDFIPVPLLSTPAGFAELEAEIVAGGVPSMVVIDTLALSLGDVDENDAGELGNVLRGIIRLRDKYGCAFLLLHHLGKDTTRAAMHRVRGSSALVAAADTVVHLRRDGDALVVEVAKQRDGAAAPARRLAVHVLDGCPYLAPAADAQPVAAPSLDDAAYQRKGMVIAKLRELGSAPSMSSVTERLTGRTQALQAAWREAVVDRSIVDVGNSRGHLFVTSDDPRVCAVPPRTPRSREPGTALSGSGSGSENGRGTAGNRREPHGNRGGTDRELPTGDGGA